MIFSISIVLKSIGLRKKVPEGSIIKIKKKAADYYELWDVMLNRALNIMDSNIIYSDTEKQGSFFMLRHYHGNIGLSLALISLLLSVRDITGIGIMASIALGCIYVFIVLSLFPGTETKFYLDRLHEKEEYRHIWERIKCWDEENGKVIVRLKSSKGAKIGIVVSAIVAFLFLFVF